MSGGSSDWNGDFHITHGWRVHDKTPCDKTPSTKLNFGWHLTDLPEYICTAWLMMDTQKDVLNGHFVRPINGE